MKKYLFPQNKYEICCFSIWNVLVLVLTAQKLKFSIKDFFSKCDQTRKKLQFGHIN